MEVWIDKFVLAFLVIILGAVVLTNPWQFDRIQMVAFIVAMVALSVFAARTIERRREVETEPGIVTPQGEVDSKQSDGQGGRGGGGNAIGKDSKVLGGKGGKGGSHGGGHGGEGGGGDAVGEGSKVIGGDGGDGGRSDGRGGMGGVSPLKKLSPEELKSWGLTGNEGYGQGGRGANSAEYDRSLKALSFLSAEYALQHSNSQMIPMPGVLMPPVEWVNSRLSQMQETFRVELIDNGADFLLRPMSQQ